MGADMTNQSEFPPSRVLGAIAVAGAIMFPQASVLAAGDASPPATTASAVSFDVVARELKVGDLVFIRIAFRPFAEVAAATGTWTNHVGIVVDVSGGAPQ